MNKKRAVPTALATLVTTSSHLLAVSGAMRHTVDVPLDHDNVAQSTNATVAVDVRLEKAKFRPPRVAVDPPDRGEFSNPTKNELTAGALRPNHSEYMTIVIHRMQSFAQGVMPVDHQSVACLRTVK